MACSLGPCAGAGLRLLLVASLTLLPQSQPSCVVGRRCEGQGPLPADGLGVLSSDGLLRVQIVCAGENQAEGQEFAGVQVSAVGRSSQGLAELNISADGSSLTFGFTGHTEHIPSLDSYRLCWCQRDLSLGENCSNNSGFRTRLGKLKVIGPDQRTTYQCSRGQSCDIDAQGVGLEAGDRMTILTSCGQSQEFLWGLPGRKYFETQDGQGFAFPASTQEISSGSFDARVQARPGIYMLCFCRPEGSDPGSCTRSLDFVAPAGIITIDGPYTSQRFSCVLGQACSVSALQGLKLRQGDRLMVLLSCGEDSRGTLGPARYETTGDGSSYVLGTWPLEVTNPGEYQLCWCKPGSSNPCESPSDFAAVGGLLELMCPVRYYRNGAFCQLCESSHYCPGEPAQMRMGCPQGSSTEMLGAMDVSQCLCPSGSYASSGNGTAQLVCQTCSWGTFAFGRGLTECTNSTLTCVVGQSCRQLGPLSRIDAGSGGSLRAMKRCGAEEQISRLSLSETSPVGNATLVSRASGTWVSFGSGSLNVEPSMGYPVCWCGDVDTGCADNTRFRLELGYLQVEGPTYDEYDEWMCTLGRPCSVEGVRGVGLRVGDRAAVSYSCGVDLPLPFGIPGNGIAVYNGSGFYFEVLATQGSSTILEAEPGIYRLCYCRPNGPDGFNCSNPGHFKWHMGYLTAVGPNVGQSGFECSLGTPCNVIGIKGVNLGTTDSAKLMTQCGVDACGSGDACDTFHPSQQDPSTYMLGAVSSTIRPGNWMFCWCSGEYSCDQAVDYNIQAAVVSFACQDGYVIVQGQCRSCCQNCFMVRWEIQGTGVDRSCHLDYLHLIHFLMLLAAFPLLALTLLYFPAVPLQDVEKDEEATVVTTTHSHLVLHWGRVPVYFRGTCVPWLDSGKEQYMVTVIDGNHLRLLDAAGDDVAMPCDTSRGELRIPILYAGIYCGIFWVPFAAWGVLLLVSSIFFIVYGELGADEVSVILCLSILAAVLFHFVRWRSGCRTQILLTCEAYRKRLRAQNPKPQACPRGAPRALKAEKLLDLYEFFQAFIRGRNMYYICPNIVMPLTKPEQLSLSELAGPSVVDWFISHFWGMTFKHFVASVQKHARSVAGVDWKRVSYWVCTFSNNQWKVADEVGNGDWKESSFYKALRSGVCQGTAMVLDDQAMPLTRSWCLFEVLQTALLSEDDKNFAGLLLCTSSGVLNYGTASMDVATALARRLSSLRLQDASASCAEDKQMIDGLVDSMPGGFVTMNDYVRDGIRKCLVTMKDHFDGELSRLVSVLEDSTDRLHSRQGNHSDENSPAQQKRVDTALQEGGRVFSKESTADTALESEVPPLHTVVDICGKPLEEVSLPGAAT